MTKKKLVAPALAIAMIAGAAASFAGMAGAQTAATTTSSANTVTSAPATTSNHIDGNVTAISGTTITITEESNEAGAIYTVDASGATITKNGAASSFSSIAVGDKVFVQGTANGSNVTATAISDGMRQGGGPGMRGDMGGPHVDGNVTAINGTTITLTEDEGATVYTVDASKATVTKNGAVSSLFSVAVGDKLFVQGTTTGSSVAATSIMDGQPSGQ